MQVLNQINLADAIGKTIAKIAVSSDRHVIAYTDGSFSLFERYEEWGSPNQSDVKISYKSCVAKLNIRADGSTWFTSTQEMLIEAGVLDGDKLIEDAKERIDAYVAQCEESDRKRYEGLKARFEPKNLGNQ